MYLDILGEKWINEWFNRRQKSVNKWQRYNKNDVLERKQF